MFTVLLSVWSKEGEDVSKDILSKKKVNRSLSSVNTFVKTVFPKPIPGVYNIFHSELVKICCICVVLFLCRNHSSLLYYEQFHSVSGVAGTKHQFGSLF